MVDEDAKECKIIDVAVPWYCQAKEHEKIEKYGDLKRKAATLWGTKMAVVIGALGTVSENLNKWIDKI